jgi:hypothetical protein
MMKHLKYFGGGECKWKTFDEIISNAPSEVQQHIEELKTLRERPDHHPEESCWHHVKIVLERCLLIGDPDLVMTALFHDIGKVKTNIGHPKTGWPSAPDHPDYAAEMVDKHSHWIYMFGATPAHVKWLCLNHMKAKRVSEMRPNSSSRREMEASPLYDKLMLFTQADNMTADFSH